MDKSQLADVFAVLAVVAALASLAGIGVLVRSMLGSESAMAFRQHQWLTVLAGAGAVAIVCLLGSLSLSEIAPEYPPCRYCWFQRIAMYPLAVLLPMAWVRRDRGIKWYALGLALPGAAISTWHVLIERIPSLDTGSCDPTNPCTIRWIDKWGGWVTIPSMALVGFTTIIVAALLIPRTGASPAPEPTEAS